MNVAIKNTLTFKSQVADKHERVKYCRDLTVYQSCLYFLCFITEEIVDVQKFYDAVKLMVTATATMYFKRWEWLQRREWKEYEELIPHVALKVFQSITPDGLVDYSLIMDEAIVTEVLKEYNKLCENEAL